MLVLGLLLVVGFAFAGEMPDCTVGLIDADRCGTRVWVPPVEQKPADWKSDRIRQGWL